MDTGEESMNPSETKTTLHGGPAPAADELERAYRRGDEVETFLRDSKGGLKRDSGQPIPEGRAWTLSEIVMAMREFETIGLKIGLAAGVIEELLRKNSALIREREDATRRCRELEAAARRRSPNPPEDAIVVGQERITDLETELVSLTAKLTEMNARAEKAEAHVEELRPFQREMLSAHAEITDALKGWFPTKDMPWVQKCVFAAARIGEAKEKAGAELENLREAMGVFAAPIPTLESTFDLDFAQACKIQSVALAALAQGGDDAC